MLHPRIKTNPNIVALYAEANYVCENRINENLIYSIIERDDKRLFKVNFRKETK